MSYIGTTEIGKMFLGDVEIDKAYLGDDLVFSSASGPAPIVPVFYDYLYFDGTAYVDTDIVPDALASYTVPLGNETKKTAQRIFYVPAGGSADAATTMFLSSSTNTSRRTFSVYYGSTSSLASRNLSWSTTTYNLFLTPTRYGWGNSSYTISKGSYSPSAALVIGSNAAHSGNPYSGRMGIFRIYDDTTQNLSSYSAFGTYTPVVTLRPCIYNDEAGFWYVEGSKFFGNTAGSGTLTASNS